MFENFHLYGTSELKEMHKNQTQFFSFVLSSWSRVCGCNFSTYSIGLLLMVIPYS